MYMWDEKSGLAARKGVASTTSHEISHQYASPSFLRASPVESSFFPRLLFSRWFGYVG